MVAFSKRPRDAQTTLRREKRGVARSSKLWIVALALTLAALGWQWRSGPSYPYRTKITLGHAATPVSLPRNSSTVWPARVAVPAPDGHASGTVYWRRVPTNGPFEVLPLRSGGDQLAAALPGLPPAAKVEYYVELGVGAESVRIPSTDGGTVTLRYHGPIPAVVLIPHIAVMFLAMLIGVRAGLAAMSDAPEHGSLAVIALAAFTLGGFILGPITQKYAFGTFWTGVPFGWDLTDNKTLLMWIGWAAAVVAARRRWRGSRWFVVLATVLMLAVFLVPHSA
jgi:hypothetical protein